MVVVVVPLSSTDVRLVLRLADGARHESSAPTAGMSAAETLALLFDRPSDGLERCELSTTGRERRRHSPGAVVARPRQRANTIPPVVGGDRDAFQRRSTRQQRPMGHYSYFLDVAPVDSPNRKRVDDGDSVCGAVQPPSGDVQQQIGKHYDESECARSTNEVERASCPCANWQQEHQSDNHDSNDRFNAQLPSGRYPSPASSLRYFGAFHEGVVLQFRNAIFGSRFE